MAIFRTAATRNNATIRAPIGDFNVKLGEGEEMRSEGPPEHNIPSSKIKKRHRTTNRMKTNEVKPNQLFTRFDPVNCVLLKPGLY